MHLLSLCFCTVLFHLPRRVKTFGAALFHLSSTRLDKCSIPHRTYPYQISYLPYSYQIQGQLLQERTSQTARNVNDIRPCFKRVLQSTGYRTWLNDLLCILLESLLIHYNCYHRNLRLHHPPFRHRLSQNVFSFLTFSLHQNQILHPPRTRPLPPHPLLPRLPPQNVVAFLLFLSVALFQCHPKNHK